MHMQELLARRKVWAGLSSDERVSEAARLSMHGTQHGTPPIIDPVMFAWYCLNNTELPVRRLNIGAYIPDRAPKTSGVSRTYSRYSK